MWSLLGALAFSATASGQADYSVTILERPAGAFSFVGRAMNGDGTIVGWTQITIPSGGYSTNAFRWTESGGAEVLPSPPGMANAQGGAIAVDNGVDAGQIWLWNSGVYTEIGTLPGFPGGRTTGINASNEICGVAFAYTISVSPQAMYSTGGVLAPVIDSSCRSVTDINDPGQIVGNVGYDAFRWTAGVPEYFGPLGPFERTFAYAINNNGVCVGQARLPFTAPDESRGFIWTESDGIQAIPPLTGENRAIDINDFGVVIGHSEYGSGNYPWTWTEATGTLPIADRVDAPPSLSIWHLIAINNAGQILADGYDSSIPDFVVMRLEPLGLPTEPRFRRGDANADGGIDISDVIFVLGVLFQATSERSCADALDANDDGVIDIADAIRLLAALFTPGSQSLPAPTGCGPDPTTDSLGCDMSICSP